MSRAERPPTLPTCLAIILCEDVYQIQPQTNLIIVNTFHAITCAKIPCRFGKITVMFTLANGHGEYVVELRISEATSGETIMKATGDVKLADPLAIADRSVRLLGVPFRSAGKHWMELHTNGTLIAQRPFYVMARTPSEES